MIKILVCFKIIRDFEGITPSELCSLRDGALNVSFFKKIIGSYDEAALESARRLAQSIPPEETCVLHAVTVGPCEARFAKDLYAIGFDEVLNIQPSGGAYNPEDTAACICDFVQCPGGYNAILTGQQTWPNESGLVPYILAKRLGMPCISQVIELLWENGIHMKAKTDRGGISCTVHTPAVYIVGDAVHPYLKIATLQEKLRANNHSLRTIEPSPVFPQMDLGRTKRLLYEKQERRCRFVEGDTAQEKAKNFLEEVMIQCRKL